VVFPKRSFLPGKSKINDIYSISLARRSSSVAAIQRFIPQEVIMTMDDVRTRVKSVIAHVLKADSALIADEANFIFDLGADSMQSLELVAAFEEEFGIEMDEDKALEVQTVNEAVEFISGYLRKKQ
jgi:acyl carrier protein